MDIQVAIDQAGRSASDSLYNKDWVVEKLKRGREREWERKVEGGEMLRIKKGSIIIIDERG